jgi:hypothetical protein
LYPGWYGGRTAHLHCKVLIDSKEVVACQSFFEDEVNAEIFGSWDPYREHVAKRAHSIATIPSSTRTATVTWQAFTAWSIVSTGQAW